MVHPCSIWLDQILTAAGGDRRDREVGKQADPGLRGVKPRYAYHPPGSEPWNWGRIMDSIGCSAEYRTRDNTLFESVSRELVSLSPA